MIIDSQGATRRQFLMGLAASPFVMSSVAQADEPVDWRKSLLDQDRNLELYRPSTKERFKFCYWHKDSGFDRDAYLRAVWILRDAEYDRQKFIDPSLLDSLWLTQEWLRREGRNPEIEIYSGYRCPEHNFRLEAAAKQSLHMNGQAADIHVPGVSTRLLAAMSMVIGAGGVGIYLDKGFVHMDTGRIRTWKG